MARSVYFERTDISPTFSLCGAIVGWLLLDRIHAPGWVYGALFTVVGVAFVINTAWVIVYAWSDSAKALKADEIERRLSALERRR